MKKITIKAHIGTGLNKKPAGEKVVDFPESFAEASKAPGWGETRVLELAARSYVIDEQRALRMAIEADPNSPMAIFKGLSKEKQAELIAALNKAAAAKK